MSFNYSVNLTDVFAAYDPQDSLVSQAVNAALAGWSQYISGVGTLKGPGQRPVPRRHQRQHRRYHPRRRRTDDVQLRRR